MCVCVFWSTWHVWKLNKDQSLTVGHVHNHSEIISETGRWVDLPGPWSQWRQERQAIKPVRALNITDIMKKMEISFYWGYKYYSSLTRPSYCTIFHSVTCACGFTQIFILSSHHHSCLWIRDSRCSSLITPKHRDESLNQPEKLLFSEDSGKSLLCHLFPLRACCVCY